MVGKCLQQSVLFDKILLIIIVARVPLTILEILQQKIGISTTLESGPNPFFIVACLHRWDDYKGWHTSLKIWTCIKLPSFPLNHDLFNSGKHHMLDREGIKEMDMRDTFFGRQIQDHCNMIIYQVDNIRRSSTQSLLVLPLKIDHVMIKR